MISAGRLQKDIQGCCKARANNGHVYWHLFTIGPQALTTIKVFCGMASGKPNKLAFLSMPAPASYVAGLGRG